MGGGARAADAPGRDRRRWRGVRGGHRLRLRRPVQRRSAGTADDAVRRRARRRGVRRRRAAQRQADVLRRPGPVRRLRREGAVEHDPVRAADVRRRHRASGAPEPPNVTTTPTGTPGLSARPYDEDFALVRNSSATGSGSRPTPAAVRSYRSSWPAGRCSPGPSSTSPPPPATVRCSPLTAPSSPGCTSWRPSTDLDAAFSRPTLDNADGEPEAVNSVAAFPTRLASVTTASDAHGLLGPDGIAQRQKLVLIPGQFVASGTTSGRGTQSLFDRMAGHVYYSASTDWTPPRVGEVELERSPGRRPRPSPSRPAMSRASIASWRCTRRGRWQAIDLTERRCVHRHDHRSGGGRQRADPGRHPGGRRRRQRRRRVEQGTGIRAAPATAPGADDRAVAGDPPSGWFAATPTITVTSAADTTVSIDGGAAQPYTGPFVPSGLADGMHVIDVVATAAPRRASSSASTRTPPTITAELAPPANVERLAEPPVTATFTCDDTVSEVATCPPPASTGDEEGAAVVLTGTATDRAGLTATTASTVRVDLTPELPTVTLDPATRTTDETSQITRRRPTRCPGWPVASGGSATIRVPARPPMALTLGGVTV